LTERVLYDRYARALIDCAKEKGRVDRIGAEVEKFSLIIRLTIRLAEVLYHTLIDRRVKKDLVERIVESQRFLKTTKRFLWLLVDKGRMRCLDEIVERYKALADLIKNRRRVLVVVARPLRRSELNRLTTKLSKLTGKGIELCVKIDPSIIGGIKVQSEARVWDATVKGRLDAIRGVFESRWRR